MNMKEREISIPQADKVIGIPKEWEHDLEGIEDFFQEAYITQGVDRIEGIELDKSERDLEIIRFVNESVAKCLQKYEREAHNTPLEKIHILREGGVQEYTNDKLRMGAHSVKSGSVLIDRVSSDVQFAIILFHEQLHNGSYKVLQFTKGKKKKIEPYRVGITVTTRDGTKNYLEDLEEAVIQLLTEKFYENEILPSPIFSTEVENQEIAPYFSRGRESEGLNRIVDDIWLRKQDYFELREDVEEIFINAQINGRLLPLARLVERTYGKGSFRNLAEATKK